ncbi:hypothetical protein J7E50_01685 [Pedobacter sp. ISL-68]|uniref:hypothetical protein n=1 Tax=unclassified Pedobacter TaxID=2628915 RepID=UPI001BE7B650|nr:MULTISPECIES: hypothetical protein [unclassified Pedobacter]MBT2562318.1 hypothetical protein [Pedobacter sp. ISL-64]MBT2588911.1 hypothetical protein [Pedobacter sp. ISL-68]
MKYLTLPLLFVAILLVSCNKETPIENLDKPQIKNKCRVISVTAFNDLDKKGVTATISYDDLQNLTGIASTQDSSFTSFSVVYATNLITLKTKYYGDWTYVLDDKKRIIRANTFRGYYKYQFTYNSAGFLDEVILDEDSNIQTKYTLFYKDGNISKITGVTPYYNSNSITEFTYDNNPATTLPGGTDPIKYMQIREVLPGFFGNVSKNQVVKVNEVTNNTLTKEIYTNVYSFVYLRDSEQKIINFTENILQKYHNINYPEYIAYQQNGYYTLKYACD